MSLFKFKTKNKTKNKTKTKLKQNKMAPKKNTKNSTKKNSTKNSKKNSKKKDSPKDTPKDTPKVNPEVEVSDKYALVNDLHGDVVKIVTRMTDSRGLFKRNEKKQFSVLIKQLKDFNDMLNTLRGKAPKSPGSKGESKKKVQKKVAVSKELAKFLEMKKDDTIERTKAQTQIWSFIKDEIKKDESAEFSKNFLKLFPTLETKDYSNTKSFTKWDDHKGEYRSLMYLNLGTLLKDNECFPKPAKSDD